MFSQVAATSFFCRLVIKTLIKTRVHGQHLISGLETETKPKQLEQEGQYPLTGQRDANGEPNVG